MATSLDDLCCRLDKIADLLERGLGLQEPRSVVVLQRVWGNPTSTPQQALSKPVELPWPGASLVVLVELGVDISSLGYPGSQTTFVVRVEEAPSESGPWSPVADPGLSFSSIVAFPQNFLLPGTQTMVLRGDPTQRFVRVVITQNRTPDAEVVRAVRISWQTRSVVGVRIADSRSLTGQELARLWTSSPYGYRVPVLPVFEVNGFCQDLGTLQVSVPGSMNQALYWVGQDGPVDLVSGDAGPSTGSYLGAWSTAVLLLQNNTNATVVAASWRVPTGDEQWAMPQSLVGLGPNSSGVVVLTSPLGLRSSGAFAGAVVNLGFDQPATGTVTATLRRFALPLPIFHVGQVWKNVTLAANATSPAQWVAGAMTFSLLVSNSGTLAVTLVVEATPALVSPDSSTQWFQVGSISVAAGGTNVFQFNAFGAHMRVRSPSGGGPVTAFVQVGP